MSKPTATWAEFQELFKRAMRLEGHPQHNLRLYANVLGLMLYPKDGDKRRCFTIKLLQDEIVKYGPEFKEEFYALLQKQYGGKLVDILMANGKKNYETDFAAAENAGIVVGTVTAKAIADSISLRTAFETLAEGGKAVTMPFTLKTKEVLYSMSWQTFEKHACRGFVAWRIIGLRGHCSVPCCQRTSTNH